MKSQLAYLYLLSPLHTGGTSQEGNVVGIAREVHSNLPYLPSSSIRGRLRTATPENKRNLLWGNTLEDVTGGSDENLQQGKVWVGDASLLWFPVPSLSHGVVWITSPFLLQRWVRYLDKKPAIPEPYSFRSDNQANLYLRDAVFKKEKLKSWEHKQFIPSGCSETSIMKNLLVLSDQNCQVLIEASLWRQVKIRLNEEKSVQGGFRYEEAISPESLLYFPWGVNVAANGNGEDAKANFRKVMEDCSLLQLGGQESLGRGFTRQWIVPEETQNSQQQQ